MVRSMLWGELLVLKPLAPRSSNPYSRYLEREDQLCLLDLSRGEGGGLNGTFFGRTQRVNWTGEKNILHKDFSESQITACSQRSQIKICGFSNLRLSFSLILLLQFIPETLASRQQTGFEDWPLVLLPPFSSSSSRYRWRR